MPNTPEELLVCANREILPIEASVISDKELISPELNEVFHRIQRRFFDTSTGNKIQKEKESL